MGQIGFIEQTPKYCNLKAIRNNGTKADIVLADGEIWIVDTKDTTKVNGTGNYNKYIKGDGVKTAKELPLLPIEDIEKDFIAKFPQGFQVPLKNVQLTDYEQSLEDFLDSQYQSIDRSIPKTLSQLSGDSLHRTVSDEDITRWNSGTGGDGDVINNPDYEDLTSVDVSGVSVLKFKDKVFDESAFSGYGRTYLRKNIVNEVEKEKINLSINGVPDNETPGAIIIDPETGDPVIDEETGEPKREDSTFTPATINDAVTLIQEADEHIAARITHAYWDLRASVGGKAVLYDRNTTNESSIAGYWSVGYIVTPVTAGEICNVTANFKSNTANAAAGYFWAIIDNINDKNILQCDETASDNNDAVSSFIEVEYTGWLVVNHISYLNPPYSIVLHEGTGFQKDYNIATFSNSQNTIFNIQYDYDLNGRSITLPENSVLKFEGGSLKNATIKGNNTLIVAEETDNIFGRDTELVGTWKNSDWYPRWFGAYQDGVTDDTDVIQKMMNLAPVIGKRINLRLGNYAYRTTRGLILKDNVYLYGGTINAKFDNPLDWVIQTEALYNYKLTSYRSFGGWVAYDKGILKHCYGYIEGTTIKGELNKHMVNGEWDGTYCPIFGGVRMQAGILPTKGLRISGVGYGFARACSLNSYDKDMIIHAYFRAYTARDVNNVTVYDAYFTANSHYQKSSPTDTKDVIPYYPEYHGLTPAGGWIAGDGGYDDLDPEHERPKYTLINTSYAWIDFINFTTDGWSEVAVAVGEHSQVCVQNAWFEAVQKAYIYTGGHNTKTTFINTHAHSSTEYDIVCGPKLDTEIFLIKSGITCSGYGDNKATTHKFEFARYFEPTINVLGPKTSEYPNLPFWYFLEGDDVYVNIIGNELDERYQINSNWNFTSGSKYSSLYNALRGKYSYYTVLANTYVYYNYGAIAISKKIVFSGSSKTTSVLQLNNNITFNNCDITFSNLTIKINQFRTNNSKFTFKNCIIIGFYDNGRTNSSKTNYYFESCTFINIPEYQNGHVRYFAFGRGTVTINNCTFNPFVRYNRAVEGNDYLTDVTYDYSAGTTQMRNLISWHAAKGKEFFNSDTNRKEYWNGRLWGDADGYPYTPLRGVSSDRPSLPGMKLGTRFTDTDLGSAYELITNGTCGYGLFVFNIKIPKITRNIYIGRTLVEPTDGDFTANLPAGTYPVYCNGYICSPSQVTIADGMSPLSIRTKASIYSTTYTVTIYAVDGNGAAIDNLVVMVGGYTATKATKSDDTFLGYYTVSVLNGTYQVYSTAYEEYNTVIVNGRDTSVTVTMETAAVTPSETIALTGSVYSMDSLENTNGDIIQAGNLAVAVDNTSLEVALTADDIALILYSIDYTEAELNQQFAYLLMRKWFEAGHYAEYVNGAKLYTDTVGTDTGLTSSYADDENTPTNLICTASHVAGTNAVWEQATAGGNSTNMEVIAASGTTLSVNTGKYYRFDAAVNTLAITLPSQTANNVAKAVIIYFTAGNSADITITAADGRSVVYFDNYDISPGHTYELNCMYNGTKWIIGTSLINE